MNLKERINWRAVLPNGITIAGSLLAVVSVYIAHVTGNRNVAWFFLATAFLDAIDGTIARYLKAETRFGDVNDSLTDLVACGVGPALCLLCLNLISLPVAVIYVAAIQFRLARFSSDTPDTSLPKSNWFQGLSSPDCVYTGLLLGMLFRDRFDIGFLIVSVLAVLPFRFFPKGYRPIKGAVFLVAVYLFTR